MWKTPTQKKTTRLVSGTILLSKIFTVLNKLLHDKSWKHNCIFPIKNRGNSKTHSNTSSYFTNRDVKKINSNINLKACVI